MRTAPLDVDEELLLTGIEVSIFDDGGRVARRDFVNRFSRTSLEIPPRRVLRAKQSTLVFNPFHSFAASVSLKRLRYEFAFGTDDGRVRHTSVAEVVPILYETKTSWRIGEAVGTVRVEEFATVETQQLLPIDFIDIHN